MDERWGLSRFLDFYQGALATLEQLGVVIENTRLSRYEKQIRRGVDQEARRDLSHQTSEAFVNALVEAFDIIAIARLPAELFSDREAQRKLKNISSGDDVIPADKQDAARDDALELTALAMLLSNKVPAQFSTTGGDLFITECRCPVECKRISSVKSLEGQLRKARKQLEMQVSAAGMGPGIIFVDVTNPIRQEYGAVNVESDETLNAIADERLFNFVVRSFQLNLTDVLRGAAVLGVVYRYWAHGTAGDAANIRVAPSFQLMSNFDSGTDGHAEFVRASSGFGSGPTVDATQDDVTRAVNYLRQFTAP